MFLLFKKSKMTPEVGEIVNVGIYKSRSIAVVNKHLSIMINTNNPNKPSTGMYFNISSQKKPVITHVNDDNIKVVFRELKTDSELEFSVNKVSKECVIERKYKEDYTGSQSAFKFEGLIREKAIDQMITLVPPK
jgi:hypothetical protein